MFLDRTRNVTEKSYFKFKEDFVLSDYSKVTTVSLFGGDTITYSLKPDFYQFRVVKRQLVGDEYLWVSEKNGPFIYQQQTPFFYNLGMHYLNIERPTSSPFNPSYVVSVFLAGTDARNLNLTIAGYERRERETERVRAA